ncbi:hypothetical protein GCM10020331_013970 [Ectobacillus funiculus]
MAAVVTAAIVGIALFFETGVVVLIPLVFTIATAARVPVLYLGMPVIAALITMHGFVPPHPGPTAVANVFRSKYRFNYDLWSHHCHSCIYSCRSSLYKII